MLDPQTLISIVFFLIFGGMIFYWNRNDKVVLPREALEPKRRELTPPSLYEVPMEIHEHGLKFSNEPKPPRPAVH